MEVEEGEEQLEDKKKKKEWIKPVKPKVRSNLACYCYTTSGYFNLVLRLLKFPGRRDMNGSRTCTLGTLDF